MKWKKRTVSQKRIVHTPNGIAKNTTTVEDTGVMREVRSLGHCGYFVEKVDDKQPTHKADVIHIPTGTSCGHFFAGKGTATKKAKLYVRLLHEYFGEKLNVGIADVSSFATNALILYKRVQTGLIQTADDVKKFPDMELWKND